MVNTKIRLIIFFAAKDGEALYSQQKQPGADCGSDHELFIAKFRLKFKKVEKITRPFRYDLNQNPYDYTVEVRNRFKGLDLIDRVPNELWMEVRDIVQETGIKTIPVEKKCKKAKWLSGEALQTAVKRTVYMKIKTLHICYDFLISWLQMGIPFLFSFAFHFPSFHSYL